jgi:hypothetical protein
MSTPDPFGEALAAKAQSASNDDAFGAALDAHAASGGDAKADKVPEDHKIGDELVQPVVAGLSSALHSAIGGYKGFYTLATTRDPVQASQAVTDEQAKAYTYTPPVKPSNLGPQALAALADAKTLPSPTVLGDIAAERGASPGVSTALAVVPTALSFMGLPRGLGPEVAARTAEDAAATTAARQSGGAAGTATDLSETSEPLKAAISQASQKTGGAVNADALRNHVAAEKNGLVGEAALTKGQALQDPVQFSEEQNRSVDPRMAARLANQNNALVNDFDRIRQEASPTNVANNARENGQVVLDNLKAYDEPVRANVKAEYQKLEDMNGGAIPIDTGAMSSNIAARMKKGSLTRTAANDPAISEVMDNIQSGAPMDFEQYESSRSLMSGIQRSAKGTPNAVAAGIVRDELEKLPLPENATPLKVQADKARAAASARFQQMEQDPAYAAAVDDVTNGTPKGRKSPLADNFLDDHVMSKTAPRSEVESLMQKLSPDGQGAVASHALNKVRDSAMGASGTSDTPTITPAAYGRAMQKYGDKLTVALPQETLSDLEGNLRAVRLTKQAPPGSSIAPKSGVIVRNALEAGAQTGANLVTKGGFGVAKKLGIIDKILPDNFIKDALKPGAGLDQLKTKP